MKGLVIGKQGWILAALVTLSALTGLGYRQLYLPRLTELQVLTAEASRLQTEVQRLKAQPEPRPFSRSDWTALTARVPQGREEERLVKALQMAGMKAGVKLDLLVMKLEEEHQQKPAGPLLPLPLSLKAQGSYAQMEAFLGELISLQRLLRVDSWTLTAAEQPRILTVQATAFSTNLAPVPALPAPATETSFGKADPTQ